MIKKLFYWALDYAYVLHWQLRSLFSRTSPNQFRQPGGESIILIPGVYESWRFMQPIARVLFEHGYDVHTLDGLGYNRSSIEDMASVVDTYIHSEHLSRVTIVAHSKGGLIGKLALSTTDTIQGLVTINTPFSGSKYAYILPFKQLRVFIPNSRILTMLAVLTHLNKKVSSIYGIFDPHIPGGSVLDGAHNIQITSARGHFRILNNPDVHAAVLTELESLARC